VYFAGVAAERWLTRFSWIALVVVVLCGGVVAIPLRKRTARAVAEYETQHGRETGQTTA
jgi:hypothetical protein